MNDRFISAWLLLLVLWTSSSCFLEKNEEAAFRGSGTSLNPSQSGVWRGFWIQDGYRGDMQFDLKLNDQIISGAGRDIVGPFTLSGHYNTQNQVEIVKKYTGAHSVVYTGTYQNNRIDGSWRIAESAQQGAFQLKWE